MGSEDELIGKKLLLLKFCKLTIELKIKGARDTKKKSKTYGTSEISDLLKTTSPGADRSAPERGPVVEGSVHSLGPLLKVMSSVLASQP